jgi:hypothetical protein
MDFLNGLMGGGGGGGSGGDSGMSKATSAANQGNVSTMFGIDNQTLLWIVGATLAAVVVGLVLVMAFKK